MLRFTPALLLWHPGVRLCTLVWSPFVPTLAILHPPCGLLPSGLEAPSPALLQDDSIHSISTGQLFPLQL